MALKSNRVGVRIDQVDDYGRVISKSFLQSLIDHLPRWTSLKVWKNGTEQLLPVNTDEPVTSPIVADIQYPTDSSATEHMFTYRKSPTDVDGEAYIQSIKGNTIVWNQLTETTVSKTAVGITFTASDNKLSVSGTATSDAFWLSNEGRTIDFVANHIYYIGVNNPQYVGSGSTYSWYTPVTYYNFLKNDQLYKPTSSYTGGLNFIVRNGQTIDMTFLPQCFDLTTMFGSTKADEIYAMEQSQSGSGVAYFRSLFPLPYYQYDSGSLLSFNGTGIKTVGFNLWDEEWEVGTINSANGENAPNSTMIRSKNYIKVLGGTKIFIGTPTGINLGVALYDQNKTFLILSQGVSGQEFDIPANCGYIRFYTIPAYGTEYKNDICINISDSTKNGTYEPYTTSTTIIPTDTYFPTGMKSFGEYYDEFTSSRAYTRVQQYDFTGSETWNFFDTFFATTLNVTRKDGGDVITSNGITLYVYASGNVRCYLSNNSQITSETDMTSVLSDGVAFVCELAEEIIEPTLTFDEE